MTTFARLMKSIQDYAEAAKQVGVAWGEMAIPGHTQTPQEFAKRQDECIRQYGVVINSVFDCLQEVSNKQKEVK